MTARHAQLVLAGLALGLLTLPRFSRGGGSGSDDSADYDYLWLKVEVGAWNVRLEWWPER